MTEIRNRVKESGLITLDLGDFKPSGQMLSIDLADQLWQGLVLKEKDFRTWISSNNWDEYADKNVHVHCSVDAIIPTWAYMLVGSELNKVSANFVIGTKEDLEKALILTKIQSLDLSEFNDGRIIIKGCSDISAPEYAMTELCKRLQTVAKSIMYGEPCSTVPVFKRK